MFVELGAGAAHDGAGGFPQRALNFDDDDYVRESVAMTRRVMRRRFLAGAAGAAAGLGVGWQAPMVLRGAFAQQWGDLTGRLVYDGDPPEREKLVVDQDEDYCCQFDIRDESLMVGEDGGLGNTYVYLRSRNAPVSPELEEAVEERVTLDCHECVFVPHCLVIWYTKQELFVINSDPIADNVAFSPLGDLPVNLVLRAGDTATHRFRRPQTEPVTILCNYHPWELAFILPRDNPYMAITDMDGTFTIPRLPVGDWEFQVWHERVRQLDTAQWRRGRMSVGIRPGVNDLGTIRIAPARLAREA